MCTNINVTREKKVIVYSNETVSTIRVDDSDLQQQCYVYFVHTGKYFPNLIKPKSDYIYHIPIDLEYFGAKRCPFGSKSIGKW